MQMKGHSIALIVRKLPRRRIKAGFSCGPRSGAGDHWQYPAFETAEPGVTGFFRRKKESRRLLSWFYPESFSHNRIKLQARLILAFFIALDLESQSAAHRLAAEV